jgi:hypothetical protein
MLPTEVLRLLDLDAPAAPGRAAHLAAASGLVRRGDWLHVIADDELHLGLFPAEGSAPGHLLRLLPGTLPPDPAARKAAKPDFEVLLPLPPRPGLAYGALLALGSGSRRSRSRGALLPLRADGSPGAAPRVLDAAPCYATLRRALPALNLEGAVLAGDELLLFGRASRQQPRNALLRMALPPWLAAVCEGAPFESVELRALEWLELGDVDGVVFGITDATALPDGRIAFCAAAEDSADSYFDGPCSAAGVGLLDPRGRLLRFERLATPLKLEGIEAEAEGDGVRLLLVSDADDAAQAATLLRAWLPAA